MKTLQLSFNVIGFFVLGLTSFVYLFVTLGEFSFRGGWEYTLYADFSNASGLTPGSAVEMAGVRVGHITGIDLSDTRARVSLSLSNDIHLQDDVIASIQTKGLLGERYMLLTPGGSDDMLKPGGKIRETEAPLDIPSLLAAYITSRQKTAPPHPSPPTP